MNLFLSILISLPFLGALIFSMGALWVLIDEGFSIGMFFVFCLMGGFCAYLGFLFKKTWKPKGAVLEVPGLETADLEQKKSLTNLYLVSTYLGLTLLGMVFFGYELMKGFFGGLGLFMGLFLIWSSIVVRRSNNQVKDAPEFHVNRTMYPRNKNVYFIFVGTLGIFLILSYQLIPSWHFISPWDIAGSLFFLSSTSVWLWFLDRKQPSEFNRPQ